MNNNNKFLAAFAATLMVTMGAFATISATDDDEAHGEIGNTVTERLELSRSITSSGGSGSITFLGVASSPDGGFVTVGEARSGIFGSGDWIGFTGRGGTDAIIVKFDADGTVVWRNVLGTSGFDNFSGVTASPDGGYVAVGRSGNTLDGDWIGFTGLGDGASNATIVKFDANGNVVWKNIFGVDRFHSVTASPDGGYVAVGSLIIMGMGTSYREEAAIVKFDADGTVVWENISRSGHIDIFYDVAVTLDGVFVAVGLSALFINNRITERLYIAKFDADGELVRDRVGRTDSDSQQRFYSVVTSPDGGYVAVGVVNNFRDSIWWNLQPRGSTDAVIVKYDTDLEIVWTNLFGGASADEFNGVTASPDGGYVAVGRSASGSFGNGDWIGFTGRGGTDAILVKFDADGKVVDTHHFGEPLDDRFRSVTTTDGGYVAVGESEHQGPGRNDGIAVIYDYMRIRITSIPNANIVTGNMWSYTPQISIGDTNISISGSATSWLTVNAGTISGVAPQIVGAVQQDFDLTITVTRYGFVQATQNITITVLSDNSFTSAPKPDIKLERVEKDKVIIDASGSEDYTEIIIDLGDGTVHSSVLRVEHTFLRTGAFKVTVSAVNNIGATQAYEWFLIADSQPATAAWTTVQYKFVPDIPIETTPSFSVTGPAGFPSAWLTWNEVQRAVVGTPTAAEANRSFTATLAFGDEILTWDISVLAASAVVPTASINHEIDELTISLFAVSNTPSAMALHEWEIRGVPGGALIASSSARDPVISVPSGGLYNISLTITNSSGSAHASQTIFVPTPIVPPTEDEEEEDPLPIIPIFILVLGAFLIIAGLRSENGKIFVIGIIIAVGAGILFTADTSSIDSRIIDLFNTGKERLE